MDDTKLRVGAGEGHAYRNPPRFGAVALLAFAAPLTGPAAYGDCLMRRAWCGRSPRPMWWSRLSPLAIGLPALTPRPAG